MKKIFIYLIFVALFVVAIFYIVGGINASISALVAYITALLVTLASMSSYRKMVESRLNSNIIPDEDRDELDKIEDPHRLYEDEDLEDIDTAQILKDEKAKLKQRRRGLKETIKDSIPALSPVKIISYSLLAVGFILLKNSGIMVLYAYLISLSIPMIVIVYILVNEKR